MKKIVFILIVVSVLGFTVRKALPIQVNDELNAGGNLSTYYNQKINNALKSIKVNSGKIRMATQLAHNLQMIMKEHKNFAHIKVFQSGFAALENYSKTLKQKKIAKKNLKKPRPITGSLAVKALNNMDNSTIYNGHKYKNLSLSQQKKIMDANFRRLEVDGTFAHREKLLNEYSNSNNRFKLIIMNGP
ncbi:MAG: hypothetical protein ACYCS0_00955 [bacterium]